MSFSVVMSRINRMKRLERIEKVGEMIGDGYFTYQIVEYCSKEWGVSSRTAERYIQQVTQFLKKQLNSSDKEKILLEYDKLIHKYEKMGNAKIALEYRKHRDKITGLGIDKVEHSGSVQIETIRLKEIKKPDEEK